MRRTLRLPPHATRCGRWHNAERGVRSRAEGSSYIKIMYEPDARIVTSISRETLAAVIAAAHDAVHHVVRGDNDAAEIHLKGRPEILPVSRSYLHLFRQM